MKQLKKTILTLVALLAVTTGAWAEETPLLTIESKDYTSFLSGSKTFDDKVTVTFSNSVSNDGDHWGWYTDGTASLLTVAGINGYTITSCKFYTFNGTAKTGYTVAGESPSVYLNNDYVYTDDSKSENIGKFGISKIEVYGGVASSGPEVDGPTIVDGKPQWTFSMPGGNVTLEPEYYPQAAVADGGVTAADADARATTDDPLVKVDATKLTGAKKLMYFVSNSGTTAPAYDAEGWTDQLPNAEGFTQQGIVYVWYYPVGTDEGVDGATATYSDGDICLQSITARIAAAPTADVTLTDGDGITALSSHTGQTITVAYTRSFTEGKTSTVCLPFAYTKKTGDGSFYAFTNIEKEGSEYVATMTEPGTTTLTANTPYLYLPNATGDVDFGGAYTIPATLTAGSTTSNGWTFKGTFETIEWTTAPTGTYGFSAQAVDGISQGQFVKVGAYVRIAPMRCYLENASFAGARGANGAASEVLPETIKVRLISANGTVTAIGSLSTKTGEVTLDNDAWYSLDGRRVQNPAKGVYIKNGKKVVIK